MEGRTGPVEGRPPDFPPVPEPGLPTAEAPSEEQTAAVVAALLPDWGRQRGEAWAVCLTPVEEWLAVSRRQVAAAGKGLPDREAKIRRRRRIPVDSAVYVSEMRGRG